MWARVQLKQTTCSGTASFEIEVTSPWKLEINCFLGTELCSVPYGINNYLCFRTGHLGAQSAVIDTCWLWLLTPSALLGFKCQLHRGSSPDELRWDTASPFTCHLTLILHNVKLLQLCPVWKISPKWKEDWDKRKSGCEACLSFSAMGRAAAFMGYRHCPHLTAPAECAAGKPPRAYSKRKNKRKMLFGSNAIT